MSRTQTPDNVPTVGYENEATSPSADDKTSDGVSVQAVPISVVDKESEPIVTRKELWSYYLYYNGDNGVGPLGYSLPIFQSLAFAAGYDPIAGPGSDCYAPDSSGQCVVPWAGGTKNVSSVILVASGTSFAVMSLIFTTIGSAADYGGFGRWLLLILTVICWGTQYASVSLTEPSRWGTAMGLYMIGFITYGATLVFYAAAFPRLARNTPHSRELRDKYEAGVIPAEEYEVEESLEKNLISNISTAHSYIGSIVTLCLSLTLLLPLDGHPNVNGYVLVLVNSYWVLVGVWWFIFQQPRPGPPIPKGSSYLTIGWKQIWATLKQYKSLPYTFLYLFAFFLLADGLNTTVILVFICQNDHFQSSLLQTTYLFLSQGIAGTLSTLGFWYIQKYWKIPTKNMFVVTNVVTILIPLWGMIGIWTDKFGFHNTWEFWAWNVVFGLFQAPYYAFSQTMMAELTPPGFENMASFFGLFGLSNRASSMIGPSVVQAIIDRTGNNWTGYPFVFSICVAASLVIWFGVDITKGRRDAVAWADSQKRKGSGAAVPDEGPRYAT